MERRGNQFPSGLRMTAAIIVLFAKMGFSGQTLISPHFSQEIVIKRYTPAIQQDSFRCCDD